MAVAALFAEGETLIQGAEELRVKETDRLLAMANELVRMGGKVEERKDGLADCGQLPAAGGAVSNLCRSSRGHGPHCGRYGRPGRESGRARLREYFVSRLF